MGHLSRFIHSIDLARARPVMPDWIQERPDHTVESVFAVAGEDYCIYLADGREREEAGCGEPIEGKLCFDLPTGAFEVSCFSPADGVYSPRIPLGGGELRQVTLPPFRHDIVIRVRKAE